MKPVKGCPGEIFDKYSEKEIPEGKIWQDSSVITAIQELLYKDLNNGFSKNKKVLFGIKLYWMRLRLTRKLQHAAGFFTC